MENELPELVKWIRVQFNLSNLSINSNLNRFASDLLHSLGSLVLNEILPTTTTTTHPPSAIEPQL